MSSDNPLISILCDIEVPFKAGTERLEDVLFNHQLHPITKQDRERTYSMLASKTSYADPFS